MRRFLIKLSLFSLLFVIAYGLLVVAAFHIHNEEHYVYAQKVKMEKMKTLPVPRVFLVGGSNVAFGFDCHALSDSLNMNVYNTGVHAAIGLRYISDAVSKNAMAGDTFVFFPEYSQFGGAYNGMNESLTSAIAFSGPQELKKLNAMQLFNFITGIPQHLLQNFAARYSESVYTYSGRNFDEFGDEVRHKDFPAPGLNESPRAMEKVDEGAVREFSAKIRNLKNKGCRVLLLWPTCIRSLYDVNVDYIEKVSELFAQEGISFDSSPTLLVHPDSLAFDTPYHMTAPAIKENTQKVLNVLK